MYPTPPSPVRVRVRRAVKLLLAILALVIAVLAALTELGSALRQLVDAWRPFWGP